MPIIVFHKTILALFRSIIPHICARAPSHHSDDNIFYSFSVLLFDIQHTHRRRSYKIFERQRIMCMNIYLGTQFPYFVKFNQNGWDHKKCWQFHILFTRSLQFLIFFWCCCVFFSRARIRPLVYTFFIFICCLFFVVFFFWSTSLKFKTNKWI